MRFLFALAFIGLLATSSPARGQIFIITVDGTLSNGSGVFSAVSAETPFTFTETFDLSTATLVSPTSTVAIYSDPNGTSSLSFGSFNFTETAPQIEVSSDTPSSNGAFYSSAYEFIQSLSTGGVFSSQLLSTDTSIAPTTSLDNLQTYPMSDFNNSLNLASVNEGGNNVISGTNTFFSVEIESAPEPSLTVLLPLGLAALAGLRYWKKRAHVSA